MSLLKEILSLVPGYDTGKSIDQNIANFSGVVKKCITGDTTSVTATAADSGFPEVVPEPVAVVSIEQAFLNSLKELQCDYENIDGDKAKNKVSCYQFTYQSKTFRARCGEDTNLLNLCYPCFYATSIDDLNVVRFYCNHFNDSLLMPKLTYSIDSAKSQVYVHVEVVSNECSSSSLSKWLDVFFQIQQSFTIHIDKEIEENRGGFFRDFEYHRALSERETTLSREMELAHQQEFHDVKRSNDEFGFTLDDYMKIAYHHDLNVRYTRMLVVKGDTVVAYDDANVIDSWPLHSALIEHEVSDGAALDAPEPAHFVAQNAVMVVDFITSDDISHTITINLQAKGENEDSLYFRAYSLLEPVDIDREQSISSQQATQVASNATSLLLAFDRRDTKHKLQEFDYMWKEAIIKERDNDSSITSEELLLAQIKSPAVGLSYYWGKRCFAAGYYAQALKHFLNAYNKEKSTTVKITDTIEQLCYYIGFCYSEMGMYDRAYYYLELIRNTGEIAHCTELVNVLANSNDIRAFHYINSYMKIIDENYIDQEEVPENVKRFISFLKRRHAYCLINVGFLDQAEKEFKELLDDPLSDQYAQNELDYIKRLRQAQSAPPQDNSGAPPPTQD